ncbi:hypothetical protein [Mycetocola sp. 2940]|uniref:hypothetical protein n=1 Tax=Mycetocola sp. 2940 TaxID=3156452 RepID=UPI003398979D
MSRKPVHARAHRDRTTARRVAVSSAAGLAVLAFLLVVGSPASAAPALHLSFNGRLATGIWTTCPELHLGDTCLDTVIIASDAKTYENSDQPGGGHFVRDSGDHVILQRFWYEVRLVEDELTPVPTMESFGGTDVGVDVGIHNRLTAATATATSIPMNTTDYLTGESFTETVSVDVTWEPTSDLTVIRDRDRFSSVDIFLMNSTTGWSRDAVASGLVAGEPIPGSSTEDTMLVSARQAELTVVKGAPNGG